MSAAATPAMIPVTLLSASWRLVTALLVALSLATLPTYVLALFLLPPVPPIVMVRSFALGTILPAVVAWVLGRAFAGSAEVRDGLLQLRRGDVSIDVSCTAIATARPWWIPLPRPGLTVRLRSGGHLPLGIALDAPDVVLRVLANGGIEVEAARRHPTVVHAATRHARRWPWALLKFPLAGTLPASVLFYTHQHIAYGGTFGQYYTYGLGAYLETFAIYWSTVTIYLILWASIWRGLGEGAALLAARVAPSRAARVRRAVEVVCRVVYYGGVPALVALRFAPW
jgi:apolipoprotein N-acyltransferase